MKFETEYQLQEFRESQSEYFFPDGTVNKNLRLNLLAERMLKLINQLESELLHDSDCSVHNEPEKSNGLCDCHLSDKIKSPDLRKEVQELFNSKGIRYPEDMHIQKDVEDILLAHLV